MKNNFITAEQAIDLEFIKSIIKPTLGTISSIEYCLDACNTYTYLIDGYYIIKFAKNENKLQKLTLEKNVLSFLNGKTTLKIPQNNIVKDNYIFSIHEMIKGKILTTDLYNTLPSGKKEKFCDDIALFIHELHTLTIHAKKLNFPFLKGIKGLYPIEKIKAFLTSCDKLSPKEQNFVATFCSHYKRKKYAQVDVFGHFDIQPKNIAFDFERNEIAGIYDFGDCGFCNASYDFSKFAIQYTPEILSPILKKYEQLSENKLNKEAILIDSTYCILHCLMKDIENNYSLERGLYELNLKMIQN